MSVSVFVPSHITGFFNIRNDDNPLVNGSCGAGFLLNKGVTTSIKKTSKDETSIKINGKIDKRNETIIHEVLKLLDIEDSFKINQSVEVPIGAGFGTSAASALGTAIGISNILDLNHDMIKSGQIAHQAEIKLGSGLGDVIAELGKGIVLRTKPGAPGIGEISCFNNETIYVACKTFGEIETSDIIQDPHYKKVISDVGLNLTKKFIKNPSVDKFLDYSYKFSSDTNLMSKEVSNLIDYLNGMDNILGSSMAMLGNTVFSFAYNEDAFENLEVDIYEIDNFGVKYD